MSFQVKSLHNYHVQTQEDYYALMQELEELGYMWTSEDVPTTFNYWEIHRENTLIVVRKQHIKCVNKLWFSKVYPDKPIKRYYATYYGEHLHRTETHLGRSCVDDLLHISKVEDIHTLQEMKKIIDQLILEYEHCLGGTR
ncbi:MULTISPECIES: hypothetical protein [unclassified Granulicatella]|uniref:hypothetical protein n=1 Tax=unclassified Granulicatella TaxID=2630493 RepID=UPI0010742364|nr:MULTISPECIES: hypothetical protein [unclassified Granulicatella]MBF0779789.1 hypothetical protein [Granulicatella sp. 19428wC4_WM01]TFU96191.1 hypothetical protein E4T68_01655 [Granulicatella sp. WM01]